MISTHILDTSIGRPAKEIKVRLELLKDKLWTIVDSQMTNTDGRIVFNCPFEEGSYQLVFEIADYFADKQIDSFFLDTNVSFKITDTTRKYHVPLLLNPFGYSTYRGS